jgi:lipoprotein-anchoring transpeptidase ErfK/SrfK
MPVRDQPRRLVAGVATVLAFVPVGWLGSAALFGGTERRASPGPGVAGAPAPADGSTRFRLAAARARRAPHTTLAAHVRGRRIQLYRHPHRRSQHTPLPARPGMPLVMLVTGRERRWVRVQPPTRPNGSVAWVRAKRVHLRTVEWRLRIDLERHTVTTWRGARRISVHPIGVGQSVTPTPRGRYYLTDLVQPSDPDGLYGSFAFGLSAHSDVLSSFGAGDGQIGLHGTNHPEVLGSDVSHGCIRVDNSVIESFARHFPLGTPVRIV